MIVRVLRRLALEEVEAQMRELEKIHGMNFDEFEEQLLKSREPNERSVDTYFRWADLVHAYRGYVEGGELHCVVEEETEASLDEISALTPKRLELLCALSDSKSESINDLARKVHRNVKNVYNDLQILKKLGLVNLVKKRDRKVVPEAIAEEITFVI